MSTWEQRMSKRAKTAALKRRLRKNLEGEPDAKPAYWSGIVLCQGFEPVTVDHWATWSEKEEEWPDIVGEVS